MGSVTACVPWGARPSWQRNVHCVLVQCWANVANGGPALNHHWVNATRPAVSWPPDNYSLTGPHCAQLGRGRIHIPVMSPSHKDAPGKGSSQGFSSSSSGQPRSVCSIPGKRRRRSPNVSCLLSMTEAALRQIAGCSVQFLCLVNVGHSARVIQSLVVRQPAKDGLMDGADFQGGVGGGGRLLSGLILPGVCCSSSGLSPVYLPRILRESIDPPVGNPRWKSDGNFNPAHLSAVRTYVKLIVCIEYFLISWSGFRSNQTKAYIART